MRQTKRGYPGRWVSPWKEPNQSIRGKRIRISSSFNDHILITTLGWAVTRKREEPMRNLVCKDLPMGFVLTLGGKRVQDRACERIVVSACKIYSFVPDYEISCKELEIESEYPCGSQRRPDNVSILCQDRQKLLETVR